MVKEKLFLIVCAIVIGMKNKFNDRLQSLLREKKLSQKDLAEKVNVSQACVTYWVKGEKQPTAENIYNTAKVLDTTADYLLGLSEYD